MEDLQRSDLDRSHRLVPLGIMGDQLTAPAKVPRPSVVIIPHTEGLKGIFKNRYACMKSMCYGFIWVWCPYLYKL